MPPIRSKNFKNISQKDLQGLDLKIFEFLMENIENLEDLKDLVDIDTLVVNKTILLDEVDKNLDSSTALLTYENIEQCLNKVGKSKFKKLLDITATIEENKTLDIEDQRFEFEHDIKKYFLIKINKKTDRVIKKLFKDQISQKYVDILKNRYNFVLLYNGLDVLVVDTKRSLTNLEENLANYFKEHRKEDLLDVDDTIEVLKEICVKKSLQFVDATESIVDDEVLFAIYENFDQINVARYTEENSLLFLNVFNKLGPQPSSNLFGTLMIFNGIRKTILYSDNSKDEIVQLVDNYLALRNVAPDPNKPRMMLKNSKVKK